MDTQRKSPPNIPAQADIGESASSDGLHREFKKTKWMIPLETETILLLDVEHHVLREMGRSFGVRLGDWRL